MLGMEKLASPKGRVCVVQLEINLVAECMACSINQSIDHLFESGKSPEKQTGQTG